MIDEKADAGAKVTYEIHPSIGIARLGNSERYFVGPEPEPDRVGPDGLRVRRSPFECDTAGKPSQPEPPQPFMYRDGQGMLKRQAARFRIYKCSRDSKGVLKQAEEVLCGAQVQEIKWTVRLRNRKGAAAQFERDNTDKSSSKEMLRNPGWDRDKLIIAPPPCSLHVGPGKAVPLDASFDPGTFQGRPVMLGEIHTDSDGRLLVVGGKGESFFASSQPASLDNAADNDGWCDDTSDGPVTAAIRVKDGDAWIDAEPSWVIVAPPDYAPDISSFVTLYDICYQAWMDQSGLALPKPGETNFHRDVLPILRRARGYRWVFAGVMRSEVPDKHGSWSDETSSLFAALAKPSDDAPTPGSVFEKAIRYRQMLFAHLRDPDSSVPPREVAMPRLHDDDNKLAKSNDASEVLALTPIQYRHMRNWANGAFTDRCEKVEEFECEALDRIALQACSGGPLFPGIEASRIMKDKRLYKALCRIDPDSELWCADSTQEKQPADDMGAGRITEGLAVPWQADFYACRMGGDATWWPATHPDKVLVLRRDDKDLDKNLDRPADLLSEQMELWHFGINDSRDMLNKWSSLGIVKAKRLTKADGWTIPATAEDIDKDDKGEITSGTIYVEEERVERGELSPRDEPNKRKNEPNKRKDEPADGKNLPDRPDSPRTKRAENKRDDTIVSRSP
ncbi:conserved hypothetical protein [Paraburkholderia ribeironis]|uniref:L-lysine 6-oxidase n=1 Tax=Paraburkholderia ribeironis TaxID=1247936 RepID=A0A1N7S7D4_9BURK|nr:LodA/GoxA family CTQ-dependent oxidase [Paraburkholderia ribeironis]SIT43273.1 conserved hypothetical protein [Paraburkholderia ribeironis]